MSFDGITTTDSKCNNLAFGNSTESADVSLECGVPGDHDLHSNEIDIYFQSGPKPLPSPHAALQSATTVKPSVPELSVIIGDNFNGLYQEENVKIEHPITKTDTNDATSRSIENSIFSDQICGQTYENISSDLPPSFLSHYNMFPSDLEWMRNIPIEARRLLMNQDTQLKQLRHQIMILLATQRDNLRKENIERLSNKEITISSNPRSCPVVSDRRSSHCGSTAPRPQLDVTCFDTNTKKIEYRCSNMQPTDKFSTSEFASSHLDDAILDEIRSANGEDGIGSSSHSSPIKIDLPQLETSADRSPSVIFDAKGHGHNIWSALDSPVLGESASLCATPPINFSKFAHENELVNDKKSTCEEEKDKQFMKTILDQVSGMLLQQPSGDDDTTTEIDEQSLSKCKAKPLKFIRKSCRHKIAKTTRRRLRKMGIWIEEENRLGNDDQVEKVHDCTCADIHFKSPHPCLTRFSLILGRSNSRDKYAVPPLTEMSMNVSAIAQKYISKAQLEEITATCRGNGQLPPMCSSTLSELPVPSHATCSASSLDDQNCNDLMTQTECDLPGSSLISPTNMSLATRRYLEKYGLIEKANVNGDESTENESVGESRSSQNSSSLVLPKDGTNDCSNDSYNGNLQRMSDHAEHQNMQKNEWMKATDAGAEQRFSQLQVNLGDTLDMIFPFLDDLDKHSQQTPPGINDIHQDETSIFHGVEETGETWTGKSALEDFPRDVGRHAMSHSRTERQDASQVLSPELMEAVVKYKKNKDANRLVLQEGGIIRHLS